MRDEQDHDDALRSESEELRAANRREIREDKIEQLKTGVAEVSQEWKVDFRVGKIGVEMFEGERLIATVYSPVDAQRLLEIMKTFAHVSKIAVNSLEIVSDLHRYLYGEKAKETLKFVTDSNYILGVLRSDRPDLVLAKEGIDKPEAKA